jgi:predicted anti-sigma-YlaC factor YlaD
MDCATAREAISAMLDGEDPGCAADALEAHLADCADCATWQDTAATVTRMLTLEPAGDMPDLRERVLADFTVPPRTRPRDWLRWSLALAAISQLSIVVGQLLGPLRMSDGMPVGAGTHLEHETAAFNFAVSVALVWVAWRPRRARSQLPVLLSFAAILLTLSVLDAVQGQVGWHRLASHAPLGVGVLCAVLLGLGGHRPPQPGNPATERTSTSAGNFPPRPDDLTRTETFTKGRIA